MLISAPLNLGLKKCSTVLVYILLGTVHGRTPAPPGLFENLEKKQSDKLPTSTGERRISEPSTVVIEAPCQARTRRHKKARKVFRELR